MWCMHTMHARGLSCGDHSLLAPVTTITTMPPGDDACQPALCDGPLWQQHSHHVRRGGGGCCASCASFSVQRATLGAGGHVQGEAQDTTRDDSPRGSVTPPCFCTLPYYQPSSLRLPACNTPHTASRLWWSMCVQARLTCPSRTLPSHPCLLPCPDSLPFNR